MSRRGRSVEGAGACDGWLARIAGLCFLVLLFSCTEGRPAAFTIVAAQREPCPEEASPATACLLVEVRNEGGAEGRATCSLNQYRRGVAGPKATGETVISSEVDPGDTTQVHLTMRWEPKKGFTRPRPFCGPGIPTDNN